MNPRTGALAIADVQMAHFNVLQKTKDWMTHDSATHHATIGRTSLRTVIHVLRLPVAG